MALQSIRNATSEAILEKIRNKVDPPSSDAASAATAALRKRNQPTQQSDSVDKFGVNQAEQERLFQIRKSFQVSLNKLSHNDTKEVVSAFSVRFGVGSLTVQGDHRTE